VLHSTVTSKGQTTIPGAVRQALNIRPGDRIEYALEGDYAVIRVHPGTKSLAGALFSNKGRGLSLAQIREVAVKAARRRWESQ
jgi:AbrB family looped-hinge helix DNA binding protein